MKYLGQYIQNFIARFRNDVYLEDVSTGTIASGSNLGLDSNNKIVKADVPADGDITSVVAGTGLSGGGTSGDVTLNVDTLNQDTTGTAAGLSSTLVVSSGGTGATSLTDNAVLTGTGSSPITAESTLSYTSETLTIGAGDNGEAIIIRKASNGGGGDLTIKAGNSAAAGASVGGDLSLYGGASSGAAGGGAVKFFATPGGTASSGVVGTHIEVGSISNTGIFQIDGGITTGSTSFVNGSGVVQVATQGTIDHDSLANFVTAEHVDWAGASAGTIHSSNIPTLNQNTTGNAATATNLTASTSTAVGLGTIELGHADDTTIARSAAGKVTIESAPIQTTQMSMTHHHFFMNSSSTTVDFFFPYNNLNEASSTSQYYTRTIAPYAGKIVKVIIRPVAAIGTACKLQFHKITDTTASFGTAVEEVTSINLNTAQTSVSTAFSSATFDAGDVIGVSLIKSASGTSNVQAVIVWEYTV